MCRNYYFAILKSAETVQCYHINMNKNLQTFPAPCLNYVNKNYSSPEGKMEVQPSISKVYLIKWLQSVCSGFAIAGKIYCNGRIKQYIQMQSMSNGQSLGQTQVDGSGSKQLTKGTQSENSPKISTSKSDAVL